MVVIIREQVQEQGPHFCEIEAGLGAPQSAQAAAECTSLRLDVPESALCEDIDSLRHQVSEVRGKVACVCEDRDFTV